MQLIYNNLVRKYYLIKHSLPYRKKPVNAAVQYEAQVMTEEEATTLMESESMVNFFKTACPRWW